MKTISIYYKFELIPFKKNYEKFLKCGQFLELNIDDVVEILSLNGVCTNNEEPIFNSAIWWLEKDSKMAHQFAENVDNVIEIFLRVYMF